MKLTLFCRHSDLIHYLDREVEWLRLQLTHERQRAEIAIDELLRLRVAAGPVTLPLASSGDSHVEQLLKDAEFVGAGLSEIGT